MVSLIPVESGSSFVQCGCVSVFSVCAGQCCMLECCAPFGGLFCCCCWHFDIFWSSILFKGGKTPVHYTCRFVEIRRFLFPSPSSGSNDSHVPNVEGGRLTPSLLKILHCWCHFAPRKCADIAFCRLCMVILSRFVQQKYLFASNLSSSRCSHGSSLITNEEQGREWVKPD